jgi:hypothetical protein
MFQLFSTYLTGSLIFLIYTMIIKKSKPNVLANNWLVLFFFTLILAFFVGNLRAFQLHLQFPHLYKFSDLTTFAIAPALYLAIKYFTTPLNKINKIDVLHFMPTLLYVLLNTKYFFYSSNALLEIISNPPQNKVLFQVLEILFIGQCLFYLLFALLKLKKYQKNIKLYETSDAIRFLVR